MKYEFSRSLSGNQIIHIARDAYGAVRFRAESESKLNKAIQDFEDDKEKKHQEYLAAVEKKKQAAARRKGKRLLGSKLKRQVAAKLMEDDTEYELKPLPGTEPETDRKRFLNNDLQELVQDKQETTSGGGKKKFWDRFK